MGMWGPLPPTSFVLTDTERPVMVPTRDELHAENVRLKDDVKVWKDRSRHYERRAKKVERLTVQVEKLVALLEGLR